MTNICTIAKKVGSFILGGCALIFMGCHEEIDKSARYTFVGETIRSYLETHEEHFSDFLYILEHGGYKNLLGAYGAYTCFAPTNEAIERYLVEKDSIWRASLLPGAKEVVWTGVTSPELTELSDSMCEVLSRTHLMGQKCLTAEMGSDILPVQNMNHRNVGVRYGVNEEQHTIIYINGAPVILSDEETENGVIHVLDGVMSIASKTISAVVEETPFLSLFSEALRVTELGDSLEQYMDFDYKDADRRYNVPSMGLVPAPPYKYHGYTVFCEPDEVFFNMGIHDLDQLYEQCKKWYPEATDPSFTSDDNALHKFVAYHLLDRKMPYSRLVMYNLTYYKRGTMIMDSESNYPPNYDRKEYYETMQGTMLKVTRPLSSEVSGPDTDGTPRALRECILLNYAEGLVNKADPFNTTFGAQQIPGNVRVMDPVEVDAAPERYPDYSSEALNGNILLLDHPLIYNEEMMTGYALNEIIRMDIIGLFPELTNNDIRWSSGLDLEYSGSVIVAMLPHGYCKGLKCNTEETNVNMFQSGYLYENYQGDVIMSHGEADWSIRLPHVPAGTYELRLCYYINDYRGICQFYIDDVITGIPVDLRINGMSPQIGYVADRETSDNGAANDKQMKNRGYMKSPDTFYIYNGSYKARESTAVLRKVITTKYLSDGDHWLRFKNLSGDMGGEQQLCFDYVELVPIGLYKRTDLPADYWRQ